MPLWMRLIDVSVLLFALWTLCCHAVVLAGGHGDHLLWTGVVVMAATAGVVWRYRARVSSLFGWSSGSAALELVPDDIGDRRARVAFAAGAAVVLGVHLLSRDPWASWIACLVYAVAVAAFLVIRPALTGASAGLSRQLLADRALWTLVLFSALLALGSHRDNSDDSFYVNVAVTLADFPQQRLFSHDALHGLPRRIPAMYHIASFELLAGTLSRLSGIPALLVVHLFLGTLGGAAIPLALARFFRLLDPSRWIFMVAAALTFYLFDGSSQFNFSMHGFARIYQGKAIMWTVLVPLTAAYGIAFAAAPTRGRFMLLAAAQIAGVGMSSTGLWLMPLTAMVSVAVPLLPRLASLRTLVLALGSSAYVVAVAFWVRQALRAPSSVEVVRAASAGIAEPNFERIAWSIGHLFGGKWLALWYMGMCALAPALAPNRLARRYITAFGLISAACMLNPFIFDLLRSNVLGPSTFDRALWVLPIPTALAICATAAVPRESSATKQLVAGGLIGVAALVAFYVTQPHRTNLAHLRLPLGPKVQIVEYRVAQRLTTVLPAGSYVVAPRRVGVHIPLVHHGMHPVMAKDTFFSGAERKRRTALTNAIGHRGPAIDKERSRKLIAELDHFRVSGAVVTRWSVKTRGLLPMLRRAGFRQRATIGAYQIWTRKAP